MRQPNLVLVIVDQLRASSQGWLGEDPVDTPALDELAESSLALTSAVANYPVCSPCRAMLLTGQYPWNNGVPLNVNSRTAPAGVGLNAASRGWSDVLADRGYRLGHIGKWHLTPPTEQDEWCGEGRREDGLVWDAWTPPQQRHGFDFWYSHGCSDQHLRPHYWGTDALQDGAHHVDRWSPAHEVDVAIDFLAEAAERRDSHDQPFGLVLSINPPHQPFDEVPKTYLGSYSGLSEADLVNRPNVNLSSPIGREAVAIARQYFPAVTGVDEQLGRLLAELERLGLNEDTVVIVTSDHGMQLGSHDQVYKNVAFEESVRVPFLIRAPGQLLPGTDDILLSSIDVAPTILGLLHQEESIPETMVGLNCAPALRASEGAERPDGALYLRMPHDENGVGVRGLRTRDRKLIATHDPASDDLTLELYALDIDPFECSNLAAERPDDVARLADLLSLRLGVIRDPWEGSASLSGVSQSTVGHG